MVIQCLLPLYRAALAHGEGENTAFMIEGGIRFMIICGIQYQEFDNPPDENDEIHKGIWYEYTDELLVFEKRIARHLSAEPLPGSIPSPMSQLQKTYCIRSPALIRNLASEQEWETYRQNREAWENASRRHDQADSPERQASKGEYLLFSLPLSDQDPGRFRENFLLHGSCRNLLYALMLLQGVSRTDILRRTRRSMRAQTAYRILKESGMAEWLDTLSVDF